MATGWNRRHVPGELEPSPLGCHFWTQPWGIKRHGRFCTIKAFGRGTDGKPYCSRHLDIISKGGKAIVIQFSLRRIVHRRIEEKAAAIGMTVSDYTAMVMAEHAMEK